MDTKIRALTSSGITSGLVFQALGRVSIVNQIPRRNIVYCLGRSIKSWETSIIVHRLVYSLSNMWGLMGYKNNVDRVNKWTIYTEICAWKWKYLVSFPLFSSLLFRRRSNSVYERRIQFSHPIRMTCPWCGVHLSIWIPLLHHASSYASSTTLFYTNI